MKNHQTAKYKRRKKKELANRKARQLSTQQVELVVRHVPKVAKEAEPISPARRAFQDV